MHILVVGGSGRTGQLVVLEALSQGHSVTALARSPSSFPIKPQPSLTIVSGTPLKQSDITSAFKATPTPPTAIIVALSARLSSGSPFAAQSPDTPPRLMADSVANITAVMREHDVRRIVIMSALGAGDSFGNMNFLLRLVFSHTNMKHGLKDHNDVDEETRKTSVDFVLVRASMLAEGEAAEVKVFPNNGAGLGFMPKIARASVAKFMIAACEGDEFVGRAPVIAN